jgi:hypothetical protein
VALDVASGPRTFPRYASEARFVEPYILVAQWCDDSDYLRWVGPCAVAAMPRTEQGFKYARYGSRDWDRCSQ